MASTGIESIRLSFANAHEKFLRADIQRNLSIRGFLSSSTQQSQIASALYTWIIARIEFEAAAKSLAAAENAGSANASIAATARIAETDVTCALSALQNGLLTVTDFMQKVEQWKTAKAELIRISGAAIN